MNYIIIYFKFSENFDIKSVFFLISISLLYIKNILYKGLNFEKISYLSYLKIDL